MFNQDLRIQILCDNTSTEAGYQREHGFAAALELPNGSLWLFDSGETDLFIENGTTLGVDFGRAKGLLFSHGHYDHTGGVASLFGTGFKGRIYAHPSYSVTRFERTPDGRTRHVGIPADSLEACRDRVSAIPAGGLLDEGLLAIHSIIRRPGSFQAIDEFFLDEEATAADSVDDDLALVLHSRRGSVLLLGCCHSGLDNTLRAVREASGAKEIHAVVGGLHLGGAGTRALEEAARALSEFEVNEVYAGHCSGAEEMKVLDTLIPGRIRPLGAGSSLVF